ncbi:MAG: hypothetical protein COB76_00155 [Alphaproteobacteria bacterium]|nr:MAG: hypothetical protein COB76_00155 [Alphaproteobacteria bacterium]
MTEKQKPINDFINDLYTTKSARFCAERRLRHKQLLSHITISFLSAYIICVGALPFYNLPVELNASYLQFATFALSIFLLVISLLEIGTNRLKLANSLHENGIEINNLYKEAMLCNKDKSKIDQIREKYDKVVSSCTYNHEKIDYYEVKKRNTHHGFWKRVPYKFYYLIQWVLYYGLYWFLIFFPPAFLFLILMK